jgi:transcriptional regulator GlxA family with amidase domain
MQQYNGFSDEDNQILLVEICAWIDKNIETNIGWGVLSEASELNHKELQILFEKYLQTSPMTYIRKRKEEGKNQLPSFTITPKFLSKNNG